ncbi:MAG: hypothetical protein MHPSP_003842, partial [Paramarteilia canceri]
VNHFPRSGSYEIASTRLDRIIVRKVVKDPFSTSKAIYENIPDNISISDRSIRKILIGEGYKTHRARKKPRLRKNHFKDRIIFY